jgi:hypothetical protein
MSKPKYLSVGHDAKTVKGEKKGYLTGILYLAPHTIAGGRTLCPFSTAGCRAVCLYTAGRGAFNSVQEARIRKAQEFQKAPVAFVNGLGEDVQWLVDKAKRDGMIPAVRLNGTSDIEWEKFGIMEKFPDVQFYDYTKWPASKRTDLPPNYHLTYSFSEKPTAGVQALAWKARGVNTAVVFNNSLPDGFRFSRDMGYDVPVINGDESDLRFLDPKGVVVGLKTKGSARRADVGTGHFVQLGKVAA